MSRVQHLSFASLREVPFSQSEVLFLILFSIGVAYLCLARHLRGSLVDVWRQGVLSRLGAITYISVPMIIAQSLFTGGVLAFSVGFLSRILLSGAEPSVDAYCEASVAMMVVLLLYVCYQGGCVALLSYLFYSTDYLSAWSLFRHKLFFVTASLIAPFLALSLYADGIWLTLLMVIQFLVFLIALILSLRYDYVLFFGRVYGTFHYVLYLCALKISPFILLGRIFLEVCNGIEQ